MMAKKKIEVFQLKDKNLVYIPFHEIVGGNVIEDNNTINYFHLNRKRTYCNISNLIVDACNTIISQNENLLVNYLKIKLQLKLNGYGNCNDCTFRNIPKIYVW